MKYRDHRHDSWCDPAGVRGQQVVDSDEMARKRKFQAQFIHRGEWWVAWCDDVPGALTQGRTLEEARENLRDAIALMHEPVDVSELPGAEGHLVRETLVL